MADPINTYCNICDEHVAFESGEDGFYYCRMCGSQSQDVVDTTGLSDHLFLSGIYNPAHMRSQPKVKTELPSQTQFSLPLNPLTKQEEDQKPYFFHNESSVPHDFGNAWMNQVPLDDETLMNNVRLRYVQGIQVMIQLQCQVLVERFGATAAICGLSGMFWLRFVATSRVFDKDCVKNAILDSEEAFQGQVDATKLHKFEEKALKSLYRRHKDEPHNAYGQRSIIIWCRFLKRRIPLHTSLAVCFLACHMAREAILPTDISKWAREGKLPYMSAFVTIEKYIGGPSRECPLSSRFLFWPRVAVEPIILEAYAATIAENIGLLLPTVNFYAIARRYLEQLSLPIEKILPHACRIYEWLMPPDLWLSTNICGLPTRVCVMSILIISIRILYDINGLGKWEMSFPNQELKKLAPSMKSSKKASNLKVQDGMAKSFEMDTTELLCHLEEAYDKLVSVYDYSKDLLSYLKYCKDVVFAGLTTSYEEDTVIEQLWNFYDAQEDTKPSAESGLGDHVSERSRDGERFNFTNCQQLQDGQVSRMKTRNQLRRSMSMDNNDTEVDTDSHKWMTPKEEALRRIKLDMKLNSFHYLSPRMRSKHKPGYVSYTRKKIQGRLNFVADADYYILLRTCARLAQIDIRIMHLGALKLERRLSWIEKQIDNRLKLWPHLKGNLGDDDMSDCDDVPEQKES